MTLKSLSRIKLLFACYIAMFLLISFPLYSNQNISVKASVNGKYRELLQIVHCAKDKKQYGTFHDWGYWTGSAWCGQKVNQGYWVWVVPNWYIWKIKSDSAPGESQTQNTFLK